MPLGGGTNQIISGEVDGGYANAVYLAAQVADGGNASGN